MAKTKETGSALVPQEDQPVVSAEVPAFLQEVVGEDAGRGVSTRSEDNIVPLVYILQGQSPQVMRGNPQFMEGAAPGSIWLRSYDEAPFIQGDTGMLFQSCWFDWDWVRWKPRNAGGGGGQGFVRRYRQLPGETVEKLLERLGVAEEPDPQDNTKRILVFQDGTGELLVETRYHAGFVLGHAPTPLPYIIPLSSTGHQVSREWMFKMNNTYVGKTKAPSWAKAWRLRTKLRVRGTQSWYQFTVSEGGWVSTDDYQRGKMLCESFEAGTKKAAEPESHGSAEEDVPF